MDERDGLAERFQTHRSALRAVAYRMLGSPSEADDAVQETWLRLGRIDVGEVDNLAGWLRTVVTRVCLDMLRSRRSDYVEFNIIRHDINHDGRIWLGTRCPITSGTHLREATRKTRRCWPTR